MENINISVHKDIESLLTPEISEAMYSFVEYCAFELPVKGQIVIKLLPKVVKDQITTGGYHIITNEITTRFEKRALVDVLRTIAHELVHYHQNERGEFYEGRDIPDIGGPIEDEANAIAGQLIKKYVKEKQARYIYEL
jgi:Zn-dependent peptidase ImmA (M78 family)